MTKKIVLCTLLTFFVAGDMAKGKVRKTVNSNTAQTTVAANPKSHDEEIDNFDFLYEGVIDDLNISYDDLSIDNLLDEAMSHIGACYRSGSKGPHSFDCSGFTSYVFRQLGTANIGSSSRDQYARNIPVSRAEMQRGDLVFFTSPNSGRNVGHVGIVVDVDPETNAFDFIHASSNGGVIVSKSTDGFYSRRFIGVRRVCFNALF